MSAFAALMFVSFSIITFIMYLASAPMWYMYLIFVVIFGIIWFATWNDVKLVKRHEAKLAQSKAVHPKSAKSARQSILDDPSYIYLGHAHTDSKPANKSTNSESKSSDSSYTKSSSSYSDYGSSSSGSDGGGGGGD